MAYIKNEWVNQQVERPRTYQMNENIDGSVTLIDDFGKVTEIGTPVNADNMNHIEDGIANSATVDLDNLSLIGNGKLGANKDLSNLTSTGQNIANWSSNVTNCITYIPQDIKLDLKDGTITLKAGSKVYCGDGAIINITQDNKIYRENRDIDFFLVLRKSNKGIRYYGQNITTSAPTAPTPVETYHLWFNTTNNKVFLTDDKGKTWEECSLPFCYTNFEKIYQTFNGFGYLGSTIFALPGVKGLAPNGKNPDGSLKNIEILNKTVKTYTLNYQGNNNLTLGGTRLNAYISLRYDEKLNLNLTGQDVKILEVIFGTYSSDSTGKIISFDFKQPFHAVDYFELNKKLNKSGDIMTGTLDIRNTDTSTQLICTASNIDSNIVPTSNTYGGYIDFNDINHKRMGRIYVKREPDGRNYIGIQASDNDNYSSLELGVNELNQRVFRINGEVINKKTITSLGFPSDRHTVLSLGASGQTYTAPADGWFVLSKQGGGRFFNMLSSSGLQTEVILNVPLAYAKGYIPVKQGDKVRIEYDLGGPVERFWFIYAEGAK